MAEALQGLFNALCVPFGCHVGALWVAFGAL